MFAAGCMSSPSARSHPSLPASSPATVDFPPPDTPMITRTGSGGVLWNVIANASSALSQDTARARPFWRDARQPAAGAGQGIFLTIRVGVTSEGRVRALPGAHPGASSHHGLFPPSSVTDDEDRLPRALPAGG